MARVRRTFTPEFKRDAVALVTCEGETVSEVARNLGIARSLLQRWIEQARDQDRVFNVPVGNSSKIFHSMSEGSHHFDEAVCGPSPIPFGLTGAIWIGGVLRSVVRGASESPMDVFRGPPVDRPELAR